MNYIQEIKNLFLEKCYLVLYSSLRIGWNGILRRVDNEESPEQMDASFQRALEDGDEAEVLRLLEKGIDVNKNLFDGFTYLHLTVKSGNYFLIKHLVKYGGDLERSGTREQYKPLNMVAYAADNKIECLEELLKFGVNKNSKESCGNTLLQSMVMHYPNSVDVIKRLLERGFDPNTINKLGDNCLQTMALCTDIKLPAMIELVDLLVESGIDIEYKNHQDRTALICAFVKGEDNLVDILLRRGAKFDFVFSTLLSRRFLLYPVFQTVMKHLTLRVHLGETMDDEITKLINENRPINALYEDMESEILYLKEIKVSGLETVVSFYDILCDSPKKVMKYLEDPFILKGILNSISKSPSEFGDFSIYTYEIKEKFDIAKKMLLAHRFVTKLLRPRLSYLCIEKIFSFLDHRDFALLGDSKYENFKFPYSTPYGVFTPLM